MTIKRILIVMACIFALVKAQAIPAYPYPVTITQPDGTTLTIQGQGDEFYNFITTVDGYTIVKNDAGFYTYAQMLNGKLAPTNIIARDVEQRSLTDTQYLQSVGKYLIEQPLNERARKVRQQLPAKPDSAFLSKLRGLVILINYNDKTFTRSDIKSLYEGMFNTKNYTGYKNEDGSSNTYGNKFIGSVRDYYYDNSNHHFEPLFDIYGPVTVDMKAADINSTDNAHTAFLAAIDSLDSEIDFSKYDADGDGFIDMIYFIVAGNGANYSGNNSGYLWPHKSSLYYYDQKFRDGKRLGTYACSVELYGLETSRTKVIDGIGTVCHEFSHVLGLKDHYDTDYSTNGQSHDPGKWDVMAGASYNDYSRKPLGYSAFERLSLGFATLDTIKGDGSHTLRNVQDYNEGLILPSPLDNEFFILENRQKTGWDVQLPGHGMLVWRVEYDQKIWASNDLNAYSNHNYLELLRAGNGTSGASTADPFPGTNSVTSIGNTTSPSLKTWSGVFNDLSIKSIAENNSIITFKTQKNKITSLVEDFEYMPVSTATSATGVQGNFAKWNFTKCNVNAPTDETYCNGVHALAMKKPSQATTSAPIYFMPSMVMARICNPTTVDAKFYLYHQAEGDTAWATASPEYVTIPAGETQTVTWTLSVSTPQYYRIYQMSGSANAKCYVDDVTFYSESSLTGDVNLDGTVDVGDVTELVNMILENRAKVIALGDINGDGVIDVGDLTALVKLILE